MKTTPRGWAVGPFWILFTLVGVLQARAGEFGTWLELRARARESTSDGVAERVVEGVRRWDARRTAIVICDMWDQHWCRGATMRVGEMAPRMNAVVKACRERGMLIVHAPSDTMAHYAAFPQRRRAQEAVAEGAPPEVERWKSLNASREPPLPIDDTDGGCSDEPACRQGNPWRGQIAVVEMGPEDVISDRGQEVFNVLQARGIENVIVMGVHANMCVLGRPFGIRSLVAQGRNVVLMRDLTDTMYNPRRRPWVSHCVGTDLVVEHIERHWCPTITSDLVIGGEPFRFQEDRRPRVALVLGENEYHTWETLPEFMDSRLAWRGFRVVQVEASPRRDDYDFRGWTALKEADMVVISARRRAMPQAMLALLKQHLDAGKPLVGVRTASHAFAVSDEARPKLEQAGQADWPEFDPEVLGGHYTGHHPAGARTTLQPVAGAGEDALLTGVEIDGWTSGSSLYKSGPLRPGTTALLVGSIPDAPAEPVAWTHRYGAGGARVFYTSLGGPDDFKNQNFQRLLLNGMLWALGQPLPPAEAGLGHPRLGKAHHSP